MREKPDGTFDATYGRIGATATTINYPMSKWDSTLNSKLRKGYEDMTELAVITEVKTQEKYKPIEDKSIAALIDYLRQQARETVRQNYTVGSEKVSQAMVNKAQTILNNLSTGTWTLRSFNDQLIELFTVIPRRMGNVRDHLAVKPEEFPEIISREQQLLDVMAGQVSDNTVVLKEVGDENKTVLEAFGLEFSPATDADIAVIKKQLGKECENLFYKAWRVENSATRKNFKTFCKGKGRIAKNYSGMAAGRRTGGLSCAPVWCCGPPTLSLTGRCLATACTLHLGPGSRLATPPCAAPIGPAAIPTMDLWPCMRSCTASPTMFRTTPGSLT